MMNNIIKMMEAHGMPTPADRFKIAIPEGDAILKETMKYMIETYYHRELQWLEAYNEVGDWLKDNKGKGLFLFGGVGLGKSVLARVVIPAIMLKYYNKVMSVYDAQEMNNKLDEVLDKMLVCIDDIGTEDVRMDYGSRRWGVLEVLDTAEKQGKLVIMTTNFSLEELIAKYGERAVDRIKAITKRVMFTGKSFR